MADSLKPLNPPLATANASANTYSDPNGLAALKKDPNSPEAHRAVAQQVDALFLQMMLKSMRDASAAAGGPSSNEMGMYQDMFDKQIALTMSQHQGLGLGTLLMRQQGGTPVAGAVAAAGATAGGLVARPPGAGAAVGAAAGVSTPAPTAAAGSSAAPAPSAATAAPPTTLLQDATEFVDRVLPTIRAAAQSLGLNPLALLAQAALETGWGKRMPRTADGNSSLNLFGIKADDHWEGARASARTVEYTDGVATQRHTAFRAYDSIEASVKDFARLLKQSPRYAHAVAAGGNGPAYVARIGASGYATDPGYTNKLNEVLHGGVLRAALMVSSAKQRAGSTKL